VATYKRAGKPTWMVADTAIYVDLLLLFDNMQELS
jgi:hypothetical protein